MGMGVVGGRYLSVRLRQYLVGGGYEKADESFRSAKNFFAFGELSSMWSGGVPSTSQIFTIWSNSFCPEKRGSPTCISTKIQPRLHMSLNNQSMYGDMVICKFCISYIYLIYYIFSSLSI